MKKALYILALMFASLVNSSAQSSVALGTKINELKFTDYVQNISDQDAFKGKFKVLEFWATWCGPCLKAVPHLNELKESFNDHKNLIFLSISYEKPEVMQKTLGRLSFKTAVVSDQTQTVFESLGVKQAGVIRIPQTFIVDNNNVVRWKGKPSELTHELINGILNEKIN